MPLVRIALTPDAPPQRGRAIGELVHRAMVDVINVPPDDQFQIISHGAGTDVVYPASYLGIAYSPGLVLIQITLSAGRSTELKRALYARVADELSARLGLRREEVFINLVEVAKENWSFGNGVMQYA